MTKNLALPKQNVSDDLIRQASYLTINELDSNYHVDNVQQALMDTLGLKEASKWASGDILLFARMRMNKELVFAETSNGQGGDLLVEALRFAGETYGSRIRPQGTVQLIAWKVHLYDRFWILENVDGLDVRIWAEKPMQEPTEMGFNKWLQELATDMAKWQTLANYYRTSAIFYRDIRRADLPWSAHYELGNLAGGSVDATTRGLLRTAEKTKEVLRIMDKLEEEGPLTLARIWEAKKQHRDNQDGFKWMYPWVPNLTVEDTETGEEYEAIQFTNAADPEAPDPEVFYAQCVILAGANVYTGLGKKCPMYLRGNDLLMEDGRLIGTLINQDIPVVEKACEKLANILNWQIYDETVGRFYEKYPHSKRG